MSFTPFRVVSLALGCAASLLAQDWFAPARKQVIPAAPGAGIWTPVAVADFDRDGSVEVLAWSSTGIQALLVRDAAGRFVDRAAERLTVPFAGGVVGDLDGDGFPDLVGPPYLRNDGTGGFVDVTATAWPGVDPNSRARLVFDVDADGDLDVLVYASGRSELWINDGGGQLARVVGASLPDLSFDQDAVGDIDGNGLLDVVAYGRVWCNRNGRDFVDETASRLPGVAVFCRAAVLADFDGDGDLDLLEGSGETLGGLHRYFVNDGTGHFADATDLRWVDRPYGPIGAMVAADFDGDGDADLACGIYVPGSDLGGEEDPGRDLLYLNDGAGGLVLATESRLTPDAAQTHAMFVGDLDADGDPDLVASHVSYVVEGGMAVHINDGAARFVEVALPWSVHLSGVEDGVVFGDVDGDGAPDAVAVVEGGWLLRRGRGDGSFDGQPLTSGAFATAVRAWGAPTLADLDGDGDHDLVMLGIDSAWHANAPMPGGEPGFAGGTRILPLPAWVVPSRVRAVDLDADGDLDLIASDFGASYLLANDGSGGFTLIPPSGPLTMRHSYAVADVDRDGIPDLLVANNDGFGPQMHVLIHDGRFGFVDETATRWPATALATEHPMVGDVDGDGADDVFVAEPAGPDRWLARLLVHDGVGGFVDRTAERLPAGCPRITMVLDVDDDGAPDLVAIDAPARVSYTLFNNGAGRFPEFGPNVVPGPALGDLDGDGDLDVAAPARYRTDLAFGQARQIACPNVPRVGERLDLVVSVRRRVATVPTVVLPILGIPAAPAEVPGIGRVWLDVVGTLPLPWAALPPDGGSAAWTVAVPNDPAVIGAEVVAQALLLAPGTNQSWTLTGPVFERIFN